MAKSKPNSLPRIGVCMLTLAMATGCAPAFRAHPQLQEKVQPIKTVAIMPPGIKVYQLDVGGGKVFDHEKAYRAQ